MGIGERKIINMDKTVEILLDEYSNYFEEEDSTLKEFFEDYVWHKK